MRGLLLAVAAAATLSALLFARPHATPGPPMRDFEAYYCAGRLWRHGDDPYGKQIQQCERAFTGSPLRRYELLPFVGPPATLPAFALVSMVPAAVANVLWRCLLTMCALAVVICTVCISRRKIDARAIVALAIVACGFGPLTSAFALGQIVLPAYACALAAFFVLPLGFVAWLQPNVGLVLAWQTRTLKGAIWFAAGLSIVVALCIAVAGLDGILRYAALLPAHAAAERFSAIQLTPAAIAYGFGASEPSALRIGVMVALAAVALWLFAMRRLRDGAAAFCATCAIVPFAMPFFHEHDAIVGFAPMLYCSLTCKPRTWPFVASAALVCAVDWLGLAQRPDGEVQTLLLVGAAGVALFLLRDDLHVRALLAIVAVLGAIVAASVIAHSHPAPVWPDAMHALPQAVYREDPSAAWHAEQLASGLLARNPWWALLRSCTLFGFAMLTFTVLAKAAPAKYPRSSFRRIRSPLRDGSL